MAQKAGEDFLGFAYENSCQVIAACKMRNHPDVPGRERRSWWRGLGDHGASQAPLTPPAPLGCWERGELVDWGDLFGVQPPIPLGARRPLNTIKICQKGPSPPSTSAKLTS